MDKPEGEGRCRAQASDPHHCFPGLRVEVCVLNQHYRRCCYNTLTQAVWP